MSQLLRKLHRSNDAKESRLPFVGQRPKWWTAEDEDKWLAFTLRDSRQDSKLKPKPQVHFPMELDDEELAKVSELALENNVSHREMLRQMIVEWCNSVTGDVIHNGTFGKLCDIEACSHSPRTFYLRVKKGPVYRWVPVGRACLSCEKIDWFRPITPSPPSLEQVEDEGEDP